MDRNWLPVRALAGLLLCLVAGCGGGGGGDGTTNTNPGGSLVFSADKTSLTFDYTENQSPPTQQINITATGQYNGNLYVGATETGQGIAPAIPITVTGTSAQAQVTAASGLAAGTYTGQLQLLACTDTTCTHQIGNSPLTLSYTINVHAAFKASPNVVALNSVSGTSAAQEISIQLPTGANSFSASVQNAANTPWLTTIADGSGTIKVAAASLPAGVYTGTIQVVDSNNDQISIPVKYSVTGPAGGVKQLRASPSSMTLATAFGTGTSATLMISAPSWDPTGTVTVTVEYPTQVQNWLMLASTNGGQTITANPASLSVGSYTANIRVHWPYPSADVLVPVALTIGTGLVRPADQTLSVGAESTAASLSGSVPVNLVSGSGAPWQASTNASWLTLTKASGTSGESLTYSIDPAALAQLANGTNNSAAITLKSPNLIPVTFNLNVNKNLPQITGVGPYVQLAGQNTRVIVRGSGFSSISSLATRVTMDGAALNNVTLVNDTEIVVQTSPLSAGSHTVAISNALGVSTNTGRVLAMVPSTYAYAAMPTAGRIRSLAFDPERDSIYAANVTAATVMSFKHSGASWTQSSVSLPGALDVGLNQDGTTLVAAASTTTNPLAPTTLEALDPATLAVQLSTTWLYGLQQGSDLGFGIPTTNDGRSWLSLNRMAFVMPQTLTPTFTSPDVFLSGGPWYAVSRDGERLIIVQTAGLSPAPPMLYLNAADSIVQTNPAGLTYSYYFSLSDSGDRVLFDNRTVRDGQFNLIGAADLPPSTVSQFQDYYPVRGLVTPDGSRVYVLAYRQDSDSDPTLTPRVFVFDATAAQASLPLLGYFDIPDFPGCAPGNAPQNTCRELVVSGAIGIDGRTLFFGGELKLVVAPVPTVLTQVMAAPVAPSVHQQRRPMIMTVWPFHH